MADQTWDIFLSYAREDADIAAELAHHLESRGYRVWWDSRLLAGTGYRAEISEKIDSARKFVVIWSPHSIKSPFVIDEASQALEQGKLIPVSVRGTQAPLGFRQIHTLFLRTVGDHTDDIVAAIEGRAPTTSGRAPSAGRKRRPGSRRWLKIAGAIAGIAAIALISATLLLDRFKIDQIINCIKYGCDLDYVTYRSRALKLEFVYPQRLLTLVTTKEAELRLPLMNHQGEVEVTLFRSALPAHRDPLKGSADEQALLKAAGHTITYVGPQVDPQTKNFYAISGLRQDGKIFYIRRWYMAHDMVSAEFVFPQESKILYDKIIVDMTIRSLQISERS